MPNITVEDLTEDDITWYVETASVNMLVEEVKREELVNIPQLYKLVRLGMQTNSALICKIDGVCVGAIGGVVVPNMFNPEITTLMEVMWYVLPEYRNSRAGLMLLNAFTAKAEELADEATLSLLNSSEIKRTTLEKRGFYLSEFAFRKDCKEI